MKPFKIKKYKVKFPNSKKFLQHCITATLPFCLAGCMGVYEGGFECPPGEGVGCKSISEVNQMVDRCSGLPSNIQCSDSEKPVIWYAPGSVQCSRDQCSSVPYPSSSDAGLKEKIYFPNKEKREESRAQDSI